MKYQINNFCDGHPVAIQAHHSQYGDNVLITQSHGAMSFQHTMTPEQARSMAVALVACATEAELMRAEVTQ